MRGHEDTGGRDSWCIGKDFIAARRSLRGRLVLLLGHLPSYIPKHIVFHASLHRNWLSIFKLHSCFATVTSYAFELLAKFFIQLSLSFLFLWLYPRSALIQILLGFILIPMSMKSHSKREYHLYLSFWCRALRLGGLRRSNSNANIVSVLNGDKNRTRQATTSKRSPG